MINFCDVLVPTGRPQRIFFMSRDSDRGVRNTDATRDGRPRSNLPRFLDHYAHEAFVPNVRS